MKVNKLDKKSPDATTLIHIDQYKTDKHNLKRKLNMLIKNQQTLAIQRLQLFLIQK